jgi:type I restriction enzyme R subunit
VDLLTTGIDVPAICNIVFLRRVRSRILYEQMLGRATRRCDDIGKEVFRIFDAVDLYAALEPVNSMKPVVVDPFGAASRELARELATVATPEAQQLVLDQFVAKLGSKHRTLKGAAAEHFEAVAGMTPAALLAKLRSDASGRRAAWFAATPRWWRSSTAGNGRRRRPIISDHDRQLRRTERGYGSGQKPEDYLDELRRLPARAHEQIPALLVVTQRPRELTRQQLKELGLGSTRPATPRRPAARPGATRPTRTSPPRSSATSAARRSAMPLVPYAERVDRALKTIQGRQKPGPIRSASGSRASPTSSRSRTSSTRRPSTSAASRARAAFRADKIFDGKLAAVLGDLQDAMWQSAG